MLEGRVALLENPLKLINLVLGGHLEGSSPQVSVLWEEAFSTQSDVLLVHED